jgi:undecaprenyl-diphosphatase
MTIVEAVLLGVVQGLFMFVPVSSTSHLVLTQHWLLEQGSAIGDPHSPEMVLFDMIVHVGTLVSIAIVFRRSLWILIIRTLSDVRALLGGPRTEGLYLKLFLLGMLSTAVTGVVGFPLRSVLEGVFATPIALVFMWAVTAAVLWWTDVLGPRTRGLRDLNWLIAVGIGLAQAAALTPGLSRSGMTIVVALLLGMRRRWAAEFSFFIAIPTILGGTAAQYLSERGELPPLDPATLVPAFVAAAVVGTLALWMVLALLYRAKLRYFSYYLWGLATVVAVWSEGLLGVAIVAGLAVATVVFLAGVTRLSGRGRHQAGRRTAEHARRRGG